MGVRLKKSEAIDWLPKLAGIAALSSAVLSISTLVLGFSAIRLEGLRWVPDQLPTILGLLLTGSAFLLFPRTSEDRSLGFRRNIVAVCASGILIIGLSLLIFGKSGWLWFEHLMRFTGVDGIAQVRLTVGTAFLLLGAILNLSMIRRSCWTAQLLAMILFLLSLTTILSYLEGDKPNVQFIGSDRVAIFTTLVFLVTAIGGVFLRRDVGLTATLLKESVGGSLLRRILPAAVGIPIFFAWLRIHLQSLGLVSIELGLILLPIAGVLILGGAVWINASLVDQANEEKDRARELAESRAKEQAILAKFGEMALSNPPLQELLDNATALTSEALKTPFCKLLELKGEKTGLLLRAGVGWRDGLVGTAIVQADKGSQAAFTLRSSAPVIVEDLASERRFQGPRLLLDHGIVSGVSVVIAGVDGPFGVLGAHDNRKRQFTYDDVHFMQCMSALLTHAILRKEAEDEVRAGRDELEARVLLRTRELARANEELDKFAYIASHDLKEPLRMVASYVRLLKQRLDPQLDQDTRQYMNFAVDGANRMRDLINGLLEYARTGGKDRQFAEVDLSSVMGTVLKNLELAVKDNKAKVRCESLPRVWGDKLQLIQIFQNLIANALKFHADRDPAVEIEAIPEGNGWRIAVKDNGIGIAPENMNRLFGLFQKFHSVSEYPGNGIGLATCKKIVQAHSGRIWAQSNPGEGSTFYFTLPAPVSEAPRYTQK